MSTWFRIRPMPAPRGARTLAGGFATTGNVVIVYPDGRAYLGEIIRHTNAYGKRETWAESFGIGDANPCPAPDGWRDRIIDELERP